MARLSICEPDDLVAVAKAGGRNVSQIAQAAIRRELSPRRTNECLEWVAGLPATGAMHEPALQALDAARDEAEQRIRRHVA